MVEANFRKNISMEEILNEFWKYWNNQPLEKQFSGEGLRLQPGLNTFAKWLFKNYEFKKK
jgi:hypothetical protein